MDISVRKDELTGDAVGGVVNFAAGDLKVAGANIAGGGGGDVSGGGSSTDNAIPRWDGASGDTVQDSGVIVDDSNNITGVGNLSLTGTADGRDLATDGTKLDGIEASATADQSDAEIETAYNNQVSVVSQAEAEAGTATTVRRWTAQRVSQAIAALGGGGGGTPGGSTRQVQFNDAGAFGAAATTDGVDRELFEWGRTGGGFGCLRFGRIDSGSLQNNNGRGNLMGGEWVGSSVGGWVTNSNNGGNIGFGHMDDNTGYSYLTITMGNAAKGNICGGSFRRTVHSYAYQGIELSGNCEGNFVWGYSVKAGNNNASRFTLSSNSRGNLAVGYLADGEIKTASTAQGCLAVGRVAGNNDIQVSGAGAVALGDASSGNITAGAGSMQFGVGSNTEAGSISAGGGVRINDTGAPSSPRNGDIYVVGAYTYIRSNGVGVKIT